MRKSQDRPLICSTLHQVNQDIDRKTTFVKQVRMQSEAERPGGFWSGKNQTFYGVPYRTGPRKHIYEKKAIDEILNGKVNDLSQTKRSVLKAFPFNEQEPLRFGLDYRQMKATLDWSF